MLSCVILSGAIFILGGDQAVRVDAITRIDRTLSGRIKIHLGDDKEPASLYLKGLADDPEMNPAVLVAKAIKPCEEEFSQ